MPILITTPHCRLLSIHIHITVDIRVSIHLSLIHHYTEVLTLTPRTMLWLVSRPRALQPQHLLVLLYNITTALILQTVSMLHLYDLSRAINVHCPLIDNMT